MSMSEKPPLLEKPRRHQLGSTLMRLTSRGPVEKWLAKRSEWMIESSGIQSYLAEKIQWKDPKKKILGPKEHGGVNVLCIGGGKGHEADEIDAVLPGTSVRVIDPHDYYTAPVKERFQRFAHDAQYLSEKNFAEELRDLPDHSQDGITLFFVLHHLNPQNYPAIITELKRVMKPDGKIFVAEDIVDNQEQLKHARSMDQKLNLDAVGRTHEFKNVEGWRTFFEEHGFDMRVEKLAELDPKNKKKVRHGFFILTLKNLS